MDFLPLVFQAARHLFSADAAIGATEAGLVIYFLGRLLWSSAKFQRFVLTLLPFEGEKLAEIWDLLKDGYQKSDLKAAFMIAFDDQGKVEILRDFEVLEDLQPTKKPVAKSTESLDFDRNVFENNN